MSSGSGPLLDLATPSTPHEPVHDRWDLPLAAPHSDAGASLGGPILLQSEPSPAGAKVSDAHAGFPATQDPYDAVSKEPL